MRSDTNTPKDTTEIRYAPFFRLISLFGVAVWWGLAYIGWMAYQNEGWQFGRIVIWPFLGAGLYWLAALTAAPQSVYFASDHLVIRRWPGEKTISYDVVTAVTQSYAFITIQTQNGRLRLYKLFANDDARIIQAMEIYVPAARKSRARRLAGEFPIILKGKAVVPIITALMGLILLAVGLGACGYAFLNPAELDTFQRIFMPIFGVISAAFSLLFLYLLLWTYPRRTIFTAGQMTRHFLLHTLIQPMNDVIDFQPGHEIRTVRGIPRRLYTITFKYANGESFKWIPDEFYFPMDYVDAVAAFRAADLTEQLRRAYLPSPKRHSATPINALSA